MPTKHYPVPGDTSAPHTTMGLMLMMVKPFRLRAVVFFLMTFLGVLAWTSTPFIISQIVNELSRAHAVTQTVWILVALYVVMLVLDEALWRAAEFWMRGFKPVMIEHVRTILFTAVLKKSYSYFVSSSSGRIGHWINEATSTSNEIVDTTIWTVWSRVTGMSIAAGFLFYSHWLLGTLFVIWLVLLFTFNVYRGQAFSKLVAKQSDETSKASGLVVDSISNHLSVRVFNAREREN